MYMNMYICELVLKQIPLLAIQILSFLNEKIFPCLLIINCFDCLLQNMTCKY